SAAPSKAAPTSFILPDLFSHCPFPLTYHPNGDVVAQESVDWLDTSCSELSPKQRKALRGLKAGELTAYCYYTAPPERLRVISDFMNYLFHLDNISDGMMTRDTEVLSDSVMNALWFCHSYRPTSAVNKKQPSDELNAGKLARDFWARCIPDAGPGTQARFKETLGLFFEAVNIQTAMRDTGVIPDLESYIALRRDTSGCKPCWALIEYALDIDLPNFVVEDPVIAALNQSTNDLVTWSNDIFSYNVEQSRGDTHNMIIILTKYHGHTLQTAVDYVGDLCRSMIETFQRDRASVPSWGPEIDAMVTRYVQGLEAWIVGSLHWSFMTERYFGKSAADVKRSRFVALIP
ncbi:isoprenoid synthase domain-containing protein, partial [Mycena rosella]